MPFDSLVIKEAIARERFRGGQIFCVVPRIEDLDAMAGRLREIVPEARCAMAHGRLAPTELERVMTEFGEGKFDILLATNIVESGLDMPAVNTLIIYRADMFGLAGLYQLRGRVGRGKQRGYAYLTWPVHHKLSLAAEKRLEVMQTLDTLGAGFTLASHDLDLRGAGNLLGDEQSGHIREVGIELYQQMLEDAVAAIRAENNNKKPAERDWTPNINLGAAGVNSRNLCQRSASAAWTCTAALAACRTMRRARHWRRNSSTGLENYPKRSRTCWKP